MIYTAAEQAAEKLLRSRHNFNHRKGVGALPVAKIRCKLCDPVANYAIRVKQKLGVRSLADLIRLGITTGMAQEERAFPGCGAETSVALVRGAPETRVGG